MKTKIMTIVLILLAVGIVSSCNTENNNGGKDGNGDGGFINLESMLTVNSKDTTFGWDVPMVEDGDTLSLTNLQFIQGNSKFITASDTLSLPAKITVILLGDSLNNPVYPPDGLKYKVYLSDHGSKEGVPGIYKAFHFKIMQAPDSSKKHIDDVAQSNMFYEGGRYSLIVTGKYNGSKFIFKSKKNFNIPLKIHPSAHVNNQNVFFKITLMSNPKKWFMSKQGFLDPTDTSNIPAIDANIENSFSIATTID
jgi:predicted small secreted protein